jgi:chitinase/peptidoglycan/LPS O-acetylase OafA/YrhL
VLRALALFHVVASNVFHYTWLPLVFPSASILFAIAGSLVADSLDRSPLNPWRVLWRRLNRLLPPLWLLGAVAVPLMLLRHWTVDTDLGNGSALDWKSMLFWLIPLSDPPGSAWGTIWTASLWYIAVYLWFLLLSPAAVWLFRRWPRRTLAAPLLGALAATFGIWGFDGRTGDILLRLAMFGCCWLLGFAHHDGAIHKLPAHKVALVAAAFLAVALGDASTHDSPWTDLGLLDDPVWQSFWGTGMVLLMLRCQPRLLWLARCAWLDKVVFVVNVRAMTIYLWNNPAIFVALVVTGTDPADLAGDYGGVLVSIQRLVLSCSFIFAAILLFGWVEDVAARRTLLINPWPCPRSATLLAPIGRRLASRTAAAAVATVTVLALTAPMISLRSGVSTPTGSEHAVAAEASQRGRASTVGLPDRVVAGYWQGWGNPPLQLADVPRQYNLIMAGFAVGDASGEARFSQSVQSPESFAADVRALNEEGRRVVLAVGGWDDGGLKIVDDRQEKIFLDSVMRIIDTYHFQGIDWDLEHGIDPARIAHVTHTLKAHYGSRFLVTMAPVLGGIREKQQLELAIRIKTVLNMANPQFYDGGRTSASWIVNHALAWAKVVGNDKAGMGFMTVPTQTDTGQQTPAAVCAIWNAVIRRAPTARGVMTWSINLDSTADYEFARTCAATVLGS